MHRHLLHTLVEFFSPNSSAQSTQCNHPGAPGTGTMCAPSLKLHVEREETKLLLRTLSPLRVKFVFLVGVTTFFIVSLLASPLLHVQRIYTGLVVSSPPRSPSPSQKSYDVLQYTSLDPGDAQEKEKIQQLLETAAEGAKRSRYYNWHDPSRLENRLARLDLQRHIDAYERRPLLRRMRDRWPPDLSNPKYSPYLMQFRQLLQSWARKKRYEPGVMTELLQMVKEPADRHYSGVEEGGERVEFGKPYRSCAVVGNSGILLNRTYGSLIDSHEMVMRLNNAKVIGYEASVGSKTTLSFVNSNIIHSCSRRHRCSCPAYGETVPIVSYICQVAHFMDVAYCSGFRKAPVLVTDPRFDSLCTRIVRYYSLRRFFQTTGKPYEDWNKLHDGALFHYSSGMQAVMLALGVCEKVTLFGFGKLPNSTHHYHTNQKTELALHDYEAEYILYNDLANRSNQVPFLNESGLVVPSVQIFL